MAGPVRMIPSAATIGAGGRIGALEDVDSIVALHVDPSRELGHLGFRNFTAFLNSYRVTEAKQQLGDPEQSRTPVLTIALNLGYASLGPFNRAFKAQTGMTPTEYRRRRLAD